MKPITQFDKFAYQFTMHRIGLIKLEWKCHASAADTGYTQIHDVTTAPANGAVPLKVWPNYPGPSEGYKEFKEGELRLVNGLYVAYSTTEATLTLGTSNNKFTTLMAELYNPEIPTGTTRASDVDQGQYQVWAAASGPKTLFRVQVTNGDAAIRYLQLFTNDNPTDGDIPIREWTMAASGSLDLDFGPSGFSPFEQVAFVNRLGCTFALSEDSGVLTDPGGAGMSSIVVDYK